MPPATTATPALSDEEVAAAARAAQGRRQRRAEADGAGAAPALDRRRRSASIRSRLRSARSSSSTRRSSRSTPSGVVVRARRIQGKGGDSIVKLRPVVPERAAGGAAPLGAPSASRWTRCPAGSSAPATLKGSLGAGRGAPGARRGRAARCGSSSRRSSARFFAAHAPGGDRASTTSRSSGRSSSSSCGSPGGARAQARRRDVALPRRLARSSSSRPAASTSEAFQVAAETRAFLAGRGVDLSGEQETKTRKALEYFAEALRRERDTTRHPSRRRPAGIVPRWEWRTFGDELRRRRGAPRRARAGARAGERRGLPALDSRATPRSRSATA